MLNIKEIVLKICRGMNPYSDLHESEFIYFANKLIESYKAELLKEVGEPVAEVLSLFPGEPDSYINARAIGVDSFNTWTFPQPGTKLYTVPPTAEQIANETAEACASYLSSRAKPNLEAAQVMDDTVYAIRSGAWKEFKK